MSCRELTPGENKLAQEAIWRSARILEAYWAAHGKPASLVEQQNQAIKLVAELYPAGYPEGHADDSPKED